MVYVSIYSDLPLSPSLHVCMHACAEYMCLLMWVYGEYTWPCVHMPVETTGSHWVSFLPISTLQCWDYRWASGLESQAQVLTLVKQVFCHWAIYPALSLIFKSMFTVFKRASLVITAFVFCKYPMYRKSPFYKQHSSWQVLKVHNQKEKNIFISFKLQIFLIIKDWHTESKYIKHDLI